MVQVSDATMGAPCWNDLMTSSVEGAQAFYGALFGWTAVDSGANFGHYHIFQKGESQIAGLMAKEASMAEAGVPDFWTVYFATEDINATVQKISDAGGQIALEPMDVMGLGHMAVATDPSGASFGLWQPAQMRGFQLAEEPGSAGWFELSTRDLAAAKAFYTAVLGVEIGPMPGFEFEEGADPEGLVYEVVMIDGKPRAGLMDAAAFLPEGVPSNWQVVYVTENTDATVAKAEELGGSVMRPAEDSPFGRFAVLADPTGAVFQVIDEPEGA